MSDPYVGEIKQVGFSFAPRGWAQCWNQIMNLSQYQALFSLLGTTYGGNGQQTFALPDTRGRMIVGTGTPPGRANYALGQISGTENTTLTMSNMPQHNHPATFVPTGSTMTAAVQAKSGIAQGQLAGAPTDGCFLANTADPEVSGTPLIYAPASAGGTAVNLGGVSASGTVNGNVTVGVMGGSLPFSIMNPYLALTTVIALEGVFPSRN